MTALRNVVKEPRSWSSGATPRPSICSAGGSTPPRAVIDKLDLRAGRRYRFVLHAPDGQQFAVRVAYLEIDCRHRLVKSFVYEGKPEDEAIDTNDPSSRWTREPWSRLRKGPLVDRRARRASSPAARRAYERQAELVASLQKGASPVSKQSCCGPSSRTPEHR